MSDLGQLSSHVGIRKKLGIKKPRIVVEHEIWPKTTNLCGTES